MEKQNEWKKRLNDWQGSGLSQAEYCRRHKINEKSFYYWKRRIKKLAGEEGHFIPVASTSELEIIVGKAIIRVPRDYDAVELKRLVAALC